MIDQSSKLAFKPTKKQQEFIQEEAINKWFCCSYGAGKTTLAVVEALYQALVVHPGCTGIIAAPEYSILHQACLQEWKRLVPSSFFRHNKNQNLMELANGSTILWRATSDPDRLEGINAAWCVFDECGRESNKRAFDVLQSRLRRGAPGKKRRMLLFGTPNGSGHWTCKLFGSGPDSNGYTGEKDHWQSEDGKYAVVRARCSDNPHLPAGYEDSLRNRPDASPAWIKQNIDAQFTSATGTVFSEWQPDRHIVSQLPQFKRTFIGVDFGWQCGSALVIGEAGNGIFYAITEEVHSQLLLEPQWTDIFKKLRDRFNPLFFVADRSLPANIEAMRRALDNRPDVLKSNSNAGDITKSINMIQRYLHEGRLFVHKSCVNLIREMQDWSYAMDRNDGPTDVPQLSNDHCIDALRYVVLKASTWD